jgi:hypothetical protein
VEALGKMSIEETYKGMWSSDPSLLKSLLDAGETIIIKIITKDEQLRAVKADKDCFIDLNSGTRFGRQMASTKDFADMAGRLGITFLVPPRPLVLEPKPLEWKHLEMNEEAIAVDGPWSFYAWQDGSWEINYDNRTIDAGLFVPEDGTFDTAKAAIHEWRVNHLKSILP